MSPSLKSRIVPLQEVPLDDLVNQPVVRKRRVLVVDDEVLVAETLSSILRRAGYSVRAAYSGSAALRLASEMHPELLITDVAMPLMNGIELATQLIAYAPQCKVILFSGHATSADLVESADAGINFPLLAKPVHPTEMLRHVATILRMPVESERTSWQAPLMATGMYA